MYYIGIDIGGMSVKIGLVDDNGKVVYKTKTPTAVNDPNKVISDIGDKIEETLSYNGLKLSDIYGIGIGSPGLISSKKGIIDRAYNLGFVNVPVVAELYKRFPTEIRLSNDANVAALGEVIFGVAKDYDDAVMITLGTGVGGGVIIDKKLYEGGESKGTELGHTTLIFGGEQCSCGRKGCLEAYVSASALIRDTKRAMLNDKQSKMWDYVHGDIEKVDGLTSFESAKLGDETAKKVISCYVEYLGEGLMNFMNIFRPQAIIIGGGISGQGKYFTDMIEKYCEDKKYGFEGAPKVKILVAENGNDAGIIGAASLIKA
ncbi:MAG: ROK family protein [Clostridia bacterium]|nr:ROK family protein [Clostridia bacterium]